MVNRKYYMEPLLKSWLTLENLIVLLTSADMWSSFTIIDTLIIWPKLYFCSEFLQNFLSELMKNSKQNSFREFQSELLENSE